MTRDGDYDLSWSSDVVGNDEDLEIMLRNNNLFKSCFLLKLLSKDQPCASLWPDC